jgi:hypothetical protein
VESRTRGKHHIPLVLFLCTEQAGHFGHDLAVDRNLAIGIVGLEIVDRPECRIGGGAILSCVEQLAALAFPSAALLEEAYEESPAEDLSKADASKRIDELREELRR